MLITPKCVGAQIVLNVSRIFLLVEGMKYAISHINHDEIIYDHFPRSRLSLDNPSLGQRKSFSKKLYKNFIYKSKFFIKP